MPSVYQLKPAFQQLLRPLARRLVGCGGTPNQITVAAVMLSAVAGGAVALWPADRWPLLVVPSALLIRMALNALDGMMAREHDLATPLGGVLNELGDVVSDIALYLPLALVRGVEPMWPVVVVLGAVITEMTGVVMSTVGASRRYDGPMGKSDRALFVGAIYLVLGLGAPAGVWLDWVFGLVTGLVAVTVMVRVWRGLAELEARA